MKVRKLLLILGMVYVPLFAQQTIEIVDLIVDDLGNDLLRITIEIKNVSTKTLSEVGGYVDFLDKSGLRIDKSELNILLKSDVPLRPGQSAKRSLVLTRQPEMTGTFRYRITHLRFFGEPEIYIVCPNCGEIILKD